MLEAHTPQRTTELWLAAAEKKHAEGWMLAFPKAVMGGILLSFGAMVSLMVGGGSHGLATDNPGLNKLITAAIFPIGLIMIILTGSELVTSNMAVFVVSTLRRRTPWWSYPANILPVFLGNLAGSLIVAGLFAKSSGIFDADPYRSYVITFATNKLHPNWGQIFVKGIACNFLVCVAVFQATAARDLISKVVAAELPVFVFVCLGYDHVVANMLFIPLGLMLGADFGSGYYIYKSMIPAFLGNAVGAALLAMPLTLFFLTGSKSSSGAGGLVARTDEEARVDSAGSSVSGLGKE
ncbi:putative formate/nitrite transporter [Leucosporidium creatinivorum]|uniref:Putative formate/nitrite transporter n=1 Tax=Leucosporidium creatinivorum TaxID=106004 RepID=A0A1Y2F5Y8_9BASI|nr:putative formate/nitrite transporter [Leucosporidium creatinivorum]